MFSFLFVHPSHWQQKYPSRYFVQIPSLKQPAPQVNKKHTSHRRVFSLTRPTTPSTLLTASRMTTTRPAGTSFQRFIQTNGQVLGRRIHITTHNFLSKFPDKINCPKAIIVTRYELLEFLDSDNLLVALQKNQFKKQSPLGYCRDHQTIALAVL